MDLKDKRVVFHFVNNKKYPEKLPFDPPQNYPELSETQTDPQNEVYSAVRELFFRLELDRGNFNTQHWNPLGEIIKPGMTVFLKPNTAVHKHDKKKDIFALIVHASVLRPILDYVSIALKNSGKIIIGDSQLLFSHFDKAMVNSKINALLEWYGNQTSIPLECIDLRMNRGHRTYLYGKWGRKPVKQDKRGYRFVDLGDLSYFKGIDPARLRIAIASHKNMYKHHSNGKHEYLFPKSFLHSDAVISIPKLKTHRRTAVTLALKNFMGLPALKDSLPHYITGSPDEGGDQYIHPSLRKRICTRLHDEIQSNPYTPVKFICAVVKKLIWNSCKVIPFEDDIYEAMWYGNDTLWRTLYDLNRAVFYADKKGHICETQQRKFLCVIDGIIAGEKNGPLAADPVQAGVFVAGFNPVAVDAVSATIMGFDIEKIPLISKGFNEGNNSPPIFLGTKDDIKVIKEEDCVHFSEFEKHRYFRFEPHPGWRGHVELN
ncbi:MAG: DUF362 domain-containing protein [Thermoplasmata archaeon]|nr:MAG: DUF362 domain-containing protein [Thermoplasmata archaeon]